MALTKKTSLFLLAAWFPLVFCLWGCPPKTVIIQGKEMPVAEASKLALADAQQALKEGKSDEAIKKFELFLKDYPESEQVDVALSNLGDLYAQKNLLEKALNCFQRIVTDYPNSSFYMPSVVQLGLLLAKTGRTQEAIPTLQSVFERLPSDQKKIEIAKMLAESYAKSESPGEALRWFVVLYSLTTNPEGKNTVREQIISLIDQKMNFTQVREAYETLKQKDPKAFPLDFLHYKLAKILYHILDFERAQETLESFVATWPDHELSQEAGTLIKKIIDRNRINPNTIGILLPLTGEYREYGRLALEGIQLGFGIFDSQADAKSGEGPILVIRDTEGDPDLAVKHLEDLVLNEHVIAVIGPMVAKETFAVAYKAAELEVPIIALSLREDITKIGSFVFRNYLGFTDQAKCLASYAMEKLGVTKFALLYPNDWYGVEFVNAFWDEVERRKGEIRGAERYEPDDKSFGDPIKKLVGRYHVEARWEFLNERAKIYREVKTPMGRKRALEKLYKSLRPVIDFQALVIPDYDENIAMIAPALAAEDIVLKTESQWQIERIKKSLGRDQLDMVYLLGGQGWNSPKIIQWSKRYVQGAIFTDGFFLQTKRLVTRQFIDKFKQNFEREPTRTEAYAYDSAFIFKTILEKSLPKNRHEFRDAILRIKDFPGATGDITFGPNREAERKLFLLTIKEDQIIEIETETVSNAGNG